MWLETSILSTGLGRREEPSVLLMTQTITIKCPRTHATTKIGHKKPHRWAWQGVQLTKNKTHTQLIQASGGDYSNVDAKVHRRLASTASCDIR